MAPAPLSQGLASIAVRSIVVIVVLVGNAIPVTIAIGAVTTIVVRVVFVGNAIPVTIAISAVFLRPVAGLVLPLVVVLVPAIRNPTLTGARCHPEARSPDMLVVLDLPVA